jgi:GNAT superfamily N-acetyltransferase
LSLTPKFRRLEARDFDDVAVLFAELTGEPISFDSGPYLKTLEFQGTAIFGAEVDGRVVSMATLHILPNLGGARLAFGLVENVVTLRAFHKRGLGRGVMMKLIDAAWAAGAYKIMLLTGSDAGAVGFYEKLGFSGESKNGMQMRKIPVRKG